MPKCPPGERCAGIRASSPFHPYERAAARYKARRCKRACIKGGNLCKQCEELEEQSMSGVPRKIFHGRVIEGDDSDVVHGPLDERSHIEGSDWNIRTREANMARAAKKEGTVAKKDEKAAKKKLTSVKKESKPESAASKRKSVKASPPKKTEGLMAAIHAMKNAAEAMSKKHSRRKAKTSSSSARSTRSNVGFAARTLSSSEKRRRATQRKSKIPTGRIYSPVSAPRLELPRLSPHSPVNPGLYNEGWRGTPISPRKKEVDRGRIAAMYEKLQQNAEVERRFGIPPAVPTHRSTPVGSPQGTPPPLE